MGFEDTWYDYYRGPSSAPSITEKFVPRVPTLTVNTAPPAPLSPAPSNALDPQAASDYAPTLVNNVWRESERRAAIKAKHARERQLIGLILELLCQIAGFTCAIVFGVWAVKSYNVSVVALRVQTVANQLALRSLCADDPKLTASRLCQRALAANADQLWDASHISNPMDGTEIAMPKLSLGAIVGIVIGSVAGFLFINIVVAIWRRRNMIMQLNSHIGTNLSSEAGHESGMPPTASDFDQLFTTTKPKIRACAKTPVGTSTVTVTSTPYSGNPLTPNGTVQEKKQWSQASHVLQIY